MGFKGLKTPGPLADYAVLEIEHVLPNSPEADLLALPNSTDRP